jgi:hypothetical protein
MAPPASEGEKQSTDAEFPKIQGVIPNHMTSWRITLTSAAGLKLNAAAAMRIQLP